MNVRTDGRTEVPNSSVGHDFLFHLSIPVCVMFMVDKTQQANDASLSTFNKFDFFGQRRMWWTAFGDGGGGVGGVTCFFSGR